MSDPALAHCPDCSRPMFGSGGNKGVHDDSCPHMAALDAVCDADRVWFEEHPNATQYRRKISPPEALELFVILTGSIDIPEAVKFAGRVVVTSLGTGLRARSFAEVIAVIDPHNHIPEGDTDDPDQ